MATNVKEMNEKEGYVGYYIFTIISSVIGFLFLLFILLGIRDKLNFGILNILKKGVFVTVLPLLCAILFVTISLKFKEFFKKIYFSEAFLYLYMGFLTTVVNIIAYYGFLKIFANGKGGFGWKVAEILAFIVALIFAFVTNKFWVFKSYELGARKVIVEFTQFTVGRLITEFLNFLIMWFMIDVKNFDEILTKVVASIVVIVLNYIFSKFIIFKKKTDV